MFRRESRSRIALAEKTKLVIDADRLQEMYKEISESKKGCLILTVKELQRYFFPTIPLSRDIEQILRSTFKDLHKIGLFQVADAINSMQLGFTADAVILSKSINVIWGDRQKPKVPIIDYSNRLRFIHRADTAFAFVLQKDDGGIVDTHILPYTGQQTKCPFGNLGGEEEYEYFIQDGFSSIYAICFRKDNKRE